jgi:phosphoribosylanthranilate isomerase
MPTRIKICGINDPTVARVAAEAGADAIGLVFVERSPRGVSIEQAAAILDGLPAFVEPVAMFVDAPPDRIKSTAASLSVGTVQLHGNESPDDVRALQPLRAIKAVGFRAGQDTASCATTWRGIDNLAGLLFDTPGPDRSPSGGSGITFDWAALAERLRSTASGALAPVIIASGLTPQNVGEAIRTIQPYAVDVSSGVESQRGVKDPRLIRAFCAAVREADWNGA